MTVRDEVLALAKEFEFTKRVLLYSNDRSIRLIRGAGEGTPMMWVYLTYDESKIHSVVTAYYGTPIGDEQFLSPTLAAIRTWMKENAS